jgi:hypothetical protein
MKDLLGAFYIEKEKYFRRKRIEITVNDRLRP